MCKEYNLDWEQKPLKILGMTFTAEVFDTWDNNLEDTMHKINSLINLWSKRRLTLPGKITVIWLSQKLPGEFRKLLERKLYKFLWNNSPDRICRKNIAKNIQAGGLRMVNVSVFITSLKVTWLRRLIMFSDSDNWTSLSRINLNKLFHSEILTSEQLSMIYVIHSGNIFWRVGSNIYTHLRLIV